MIRTIPGDWSALGSVSLEIRETLLRYSSYYTIWDLDTFSFLNATDGNIVSEGFINVQQAARLEFVNNFVISEEPLNAPWIYLNINQSEINTPSCWSGGDYMDRVLQVDSGILESCRVPYTPQFPVLNSTRQDNLDDDDPNEAYCWTEFGSQTEDNEKMTISNNHGDVNITSIVINGEDSYVVLDRTDVFLNVLEVDDEEDAVWYPFELARGKLSLIDVQLYAEGDYSSDVRVDFQLKGSYLEDTDETIICDLLCLELVVGDYDKIAQMQAVCDSDIVQSGLFNLSSTVDDGSGGAAFDLSNAGDALELEVSVASWSAQTVIYEFGNIDNIYPGAWIRGFSGCVVDKDNNTATGYNQDIEIEFTSKSDEFDFSFDIELISNGSGIYRCPACEEGFFLQGSNVDNIGDIIRFKGNVISNDSALLAQSFNFVFQDCPVGKGIGSAGICEDCSLDHFMFDRSISECFDCEENIDDYGDDAGVKCVGTDEVIVSLDFWMYVEKTSNRSNDSLLTVEINGTNVTIGDDSVSYKVISADCPAGYCCRDANGCNYLKGINGDPSVQLCATNRDPDQPLCGACLDGFHEIYGTAACGYV